MNKQLIIQWIKNLNTRKLIFKSSIACISFLITIFQLINLTCLDFSNIWLSLCVMMGISLILAVIINRPKTSFQYKLKDRDIWIKIKIWDITSEKNIIIPINDQFDVSQACIKESPWSVLSSIINKYYNWKSELLWNDIKLWIKGQKPKKIWNGNFWLWEIIKVRTCNHNFYLLSNTHIWKRWHSFSWDGEFFGTLYYLFDNLFINSDSSERIAIPLLNTRHSGSAKLTKKVVLESIIENFITYSKDKKICEKLTIYIYPKDFNDGTINREEIQKFTEYHAVTHFNKSNEDINAQHLWWEPLTK